MWDVKRNVQCRSFFDRRIFFIISLPVPRDLPYQTDGDLAQEKTVGCHSGSEFYENKSHALNISSEEERLY